jgi:DNA-binding NarL/FixJ family response regulator
MSHVALQILFLGEHPVWLKIAKAVDGAPPASIRLHCAASLRDAMRCLAAEKWDAVLLDLQYAPAKELFSAIRLHSVFHAVPAIALLASSDPHLQTAAYSSGASSCLVIDALTAESVQSAALAAIHSKKSVDPIGKSLQVRSLPEVPGKENHLNSKIELISHALHNLLCIISANADILADTVEGSQPAVRSVDQIKKATRTAAELTRQLKSC